MKLVHAISPLLLKQVLSLGITHDQAAHVLKARSVRANQGVFEETLDGNVERECYEETCTREELNEATVDVEQAVHIWNLVF